LGHITDPILLQHAVLLSDEAGIIKWNLPEEGPAGNYGNNLGNLGAILTADPGPPAADVDQPFMFIHWVVRTTETVARACCSLVVWVFFLLPLCVFEFILLFLVHAIPAEYRRLRGLSR